MLHNDQNTNSIPIFRVFYVPDQFSTIKKFYWFYWKGVENKMKYFKVIILLTLFSYLGVLFAKTKRKEMTQNSFQSLHHRSVTAKRITKRPKKRQNKEGKFKKKVWRVCCKKNKREEIECKHCLTKKKGWVFINVPIFTDLVLQYFKKMRKILASG